MNHRKIFFLHRIHQNLHLNHDIKLLIQTFQKLKDIKSIGISKLTYDDIQRNGLIGKILTALES